MNQSPLTQEDRELTDDESSDQHFAKLEQEMDKHLSKKGKLVLGYRIKKLLAAKSHEADERVRLELDLERKRCADIVDEMFLTNEGEKTGISFAFHNALVKIGKGKILNPESPNS